MLAGITGKWTFKFTIFHVNVTSVIYKILARYRSSRNKYAQVVVLGTVSNKGKNQKYEAVGTKYNRQIVEICKIDTSNKQIHDNLLKLQAWYIHFSIRGEVRLISCAKHSLLVNWCGHANLCFQHVSTIPGLVIVG
jgi:hypothetical protein